MSQKRSRFCKAGWGMLLGIALVSPLPAGERWVTIDGVMTEIVFAIGAGDRVVAVDSSSTRPSAVARLPQVGYVRSIAAEGVLSMRPNRVLTTTSIGPPLALEQLRASGVDLTVVDRPDDRGSLYAAIRAVGAVAGEEAEAKAEALVAELRNEFAALDAAVEASVTVDAPPRGAFLLVHGPGARAAGAGTLADALMRTIGLANLFGEQRGYADVSVEALLARRPKVLLVGTTDLESEASPEALLADIGLGVVGELEGLRIIEVEIARALSFGPEFPKVARELVDKVHGTVR